jgi:hypothetical protein
MSRARHAQRKPMRSAKVKRPAEAKRPPKIQRLISRALDIEEPLGDAMDLVRALKQIGYGLLMNLSEDEGRPIVAVARAAEERLTRLHDVWDGLVKGVRG